ncbi:hypothetical protein HBB16_13125 [Pseudonocardia sp. MCCB 268]|nr:hypothetical protein [Pseudonocardia cytotoxica]
MAWTRAHHAGPEHRPGRQVDSGIAHGSTRVLPGRGTGRALIIVIRTVVVGFRRSSRPRQGEPTVPAAAAQLRPVARARLLRARARGPDHDADDDRRGRALSTFTADRPGTGAGRVLTIGGVAVALVATDAELALYALGWLLPLRRS